LIFAPIMAASFVQTNRLGTRLYSAEYSSHAARNTTKGEVLGQTAPRHTSEKFVAFLSEVIATQPRRREVHIILENLSAHKIRRVQEFLAHHLNVYLHFTPTYRSWLNQFENCFSKTARHVIARGIFTPP
jgi:transposase